MKFATPLIETGKGGRRTMAGRRLTAPVRRSAAHRAEAQGGESMQAQTRVGRMEAIAPHPLAQLLECPPSTGSLLNSATMGLTFTPGEVVFRQSEHSRGLYVVLSGRFVRQAERMETALTLGPARAGDLVELAAVLGDGCHTFTLTAQTQGSVLLLPAEALSLAFQQYPRLRMQLLEELAREVSRAYHMCRLTRALHVRRRASQAAGA